MIKLTTKRILEFYDVPQLFVATDSMNANYLCVLYDQHDKGFLYLAVKVSDLRLRVFLSGDLDLRKAYLSPEQDDTLYQVVVSKGEVYAEKLLNPTEITHHMLPDAGFYYTPEEVGEDIQVESIQVDIPAKDYSFLEVIVNRMGWAAKHLEQSSRKIAVL